jgi:hypothetical protein
MIWTHIARAAASGSPPASTVPPELLPELDPELLPELDPELLPELDPELLEVLPEPPLELLPELLPPPLLDPAGVPPLPCPGSGVAFELHAAPLPISTRTEATATSLEATLFMGTPPNDRLCAS